MPDPGLSSFIVKSRSKQWVVSVFLASSLFLSSLPLALAGPGDVNSTNDGANIGSGTFFNTPGDKTTFINSSGTGLHLGAGDLVTGREVSSTSNPAANLTGNGGWLDFHAPGQVVRLDGNIDVSGIMRGSTLGNGGKVTIDSAMLYQNGQIFANGANAGMIQMNVGGMTMGPNAKLEARGVEGAGGVVSINSPGAVNIGRGAVIETSGAVIGSYNTNVIQIKGGMVNLDGILMANGLNPGQQGGKVSVSASDSIHIGSDAVVSANGANGFSGNNPTDGGNGGLINLDAVNNIYNDGLVSANGGAGGTNPNIARGQVTPFRDEYGHLIYDEHGTPMKQQFSAGQNGANGGNGGNISVSFKGEMTNNGAIEAKGGNGGDGQIAVSDHDFYGPGEHVAYGGNGGNAGNGGYVDFYGNPSQNVLDHVNVNGGSGGSGGAASVLNNCGCAYGGSAGACGSPGKITVHPYIPPVTPPKVTPPLTGLTPYPKEYPNLGATLPPGTPQVLNYNRSIFLARAPIPVIQKKAPPVVVAPPPAKIMMAKPKPKPPQKKATVRGFW